MTIKTFWTIFIKILGIWLVLDSVTVIPQFFSTLFFTSTDNTGQSFALTIALLLLTIGIYILILRLFVFKTDWLIDKLQLEKGFAEEKIELNINYTTILTIATIVIGGIMFIDSLPQVCMQIFTFFQQKNRFIEDPESGWIIFHIAKTIIGYLLMTNSQFVVGFLNKQMDSQKNTDLPGETKKNGL